MQAFNSSYEHGSFPDNQREVTRLERQARLALGLELDVLASFGLTSGQDVLDLGCGTGITAAEIARLHPSSNVVGIDVSERAIRQASDKAAANLSFAVSDLYGADPLCRTYDFIYSRFVFQHLNQPERAVESCQRRLREGGRLVIVDVDDRWLSVEPNSAALQEFVRLAQLAQAQRGGDRFVGSKIPMYLKKAGFRDVRTRVLAITATDVDPLDLFDIVFGYKGEMILAVLGRDPAGLLSEIRECFLRPEAWGAVGVLFTGASKAA